MTAIETINARKAIRVMQPDKPVPMETIRELLEIAGKASSWSNSQPWEAYVLTGEPLEKLKKFQMAEFKDVATKGVPAPRDDIHSPGYDDWKDTPRCVECMAEWKQHRLEVCAAEYGIDAAKYGADGFFALMNMNFAPAWVILCVPKSLTHYSYLDLGSFGTTFMLAAKERGIDTMPAFSPCYFADNLRKCIDIPEDMAAVYGIGVGYADPDNYANKISTNRLPVDTYTHFFGF